MSDENRIKTNTVNGTNSELINLRHLLEVALRVWPNHSQTLQELLSCSDAHPAIYDINFSDFVLDSRQLSEIPSSQCKPVFVLLKSQSPSFTIGQVLAKSSEYARYAAHKVAFILSEVDIEHAGTKGVIKTSGYECPVLYVPNLRNILGSLIQLSLLPTNLHPAIHSFADIQQYLPKVVGITGTNGKTTISQLVAQLCQLSKLPNLKNSAVMGTAGNGGLDNLIQASHTTGDALAVQTFLQQMVKEDVGVIALEASSHGLDQQRLQGVPISVAIYTNLSRDHLDYHVDMDDYARAKARLFDVNYFPNLTHAVINIDDDFAPIIIETAKKSGLIVWTYSLTSASQATFMASDIQPTLTGARVKLVTDFGTLELNSPLLGRFNVANLLAAIAGVVALGAKLENVAALVPKLQGASGRMQRVVPFQATSQPSSINAQPTFIVDYAHTPDALTQVLNSLKLHCEGDLWAVFGCGGDRDSGKRPLMAQAGLTAADKVILTSDNPRSENPDTILDDMQQGMTDAQRDKALVIADRREAIYHAVQQAKPKDIVVVAGKGHETYQEINGVRYDFDDRDVLQEAFGIQD